MTDQIAAEIRKLRSTRSTYGLLAGMLAIVVLGVSATMGDSTAADLQRPLHEQFFRSGSSSFSSFCCWALRPLPTSSATAPWSPRYLPRRNAGAWSRLRR